MKYIEFSEIVQDCLYDYVNEIDFNEVDFSLMNLALNSKSLRKSMFNETLDLSDVKQLKDIIRAEIASLMLDLFKKRQVWL